MPALRTDWIRLPSMTMSTGPTGGAPVPSMRMAPRRTSVLNGPCPSPVRRPGAGFSGSRGGGSLRLRLCGARRDLRRLRGSCGDADRDERGCAEQDVLHDGAV